MIAAPHRPDTPLDDRELVAAIAKGNLEALGELFDRHEPSVRRYLVRLGVGAGDVDDLVQLTFLEVTRAAPRFDREHAARSWLLGIATVFVRRHRRSVGRAVQRLASWARLARSEPQPSPAELFESEETTRCLSRALGRLAPKKREVFVLVTLEGMSGDEVATALGVPVNTVWTRLHHARRELRAALEEARR